MTKAVGICREHKASSESETFQTAVAQHFANRGGLRRSLNQPTTRKQTKMSEELFDWKTKAPDFLLCTICCLILHESVQCEQCQNTVCSRCHTKLRFPKCCPQCRSILPQGKPVTMARSLQHILDEQVSFAFVFTTKIFFFLGPFGGGKKQSGLVKIQWCRVGTHLPRFAVFAYPVGNLLFP